MSLSGPGNIRSSTLLRNLAGAELRLQKSLERLSSGLRINSSVDDAAGLAVASGLRAGNRIYGQSIRNLNDGLSLLNIADGALEALQQITARQLELAEQAANGSYSLKQRRSMDAEANSLVAEFNRIVGTASFNGRQIFGSSDSMVSLQAGIGTEAVLQIRPGEELNRTISDLEYTSSLVAPTGDHPHFMSIADVNNDGNADLLTGNSSMAKVSIQLGNGDGTFKAYTTVASLSGTTFNLTADVDGDGNVDILATDGATRFAVILGRGDGTFQSPVSYSVAGGNLWAIRAGDFNGDSMLDLAIEDNAANTVNIFLNRGGGAFQAGQVISTADSANWNDHLDLGDVNGDGILDAVSASSVDKFMNVMFGKGDGTFQQSLRLSISAYSANSSMNLRLADFNHDGLSDVLLNGYGTGAFHVLLSNGDGTFKHTASFAAPDNEGSRLFAGDVTGDGIIDVVASSWRDRLVNVYAGTGDGSFSLGGSIASTIQGWDGQAADFNSDGVPDIAISSGTSTQTEIFISGSREVSSIAQVNLLSTGGAREALSLLQEQLNRLSRERGSLGAFQSRLEAALNTLSAVQLSRESAYSRLMDADLGSEAAQALKEQILLQAGSALIAHAKSDADLVLRLLT